MRRVEPSDAEIWTGAAWRMVEAQHIASTMKLVDGQAEQDLLESLLEESKPAMPATVAGLDYLLATPFRYPTRTAGSRFRSVTDPGVFYGAESERTAGAELGYWRWKFLMDSPELTSLAPIAHTAFRAFIKARSIDLRSPSFHANAKHWRHPTDYSATQALARQARASAVEAILYTSVRDPEPAWCVALLTPTGFAKPKHDAATHTWFLSVDRHAVTWRRDKASMTFSAEPWQQSGK